MGFSKIVAVITLGALAGVLHLSISDHARTMGLFQNSRFSDSSFLSEEHRGNYHFSEDSGNPSSSSVILLSQNASNLGDVDEDTNVANVQSCVHSFQCYSKFVCRGGECTYCTASSQCRETNNKNRCYYITKNKGTCGHKSLFKHFDSSDLWIVAITFVTIMLSAPAGTGGGGVLVPMYILIGQFDPHGAIPLSKATIFGGAIANNFFNLQRRHPRANRPLVDFRATVLLEPVLLLGTVLGVFTNAVSPGWLITAMLVGTLVFVTYRTVLKGISTYKNETKAAVQPEIPQTVATEEERKSLIAPITKDFGDGVDAARRLELELLMKAESRAIWWKEIGILCVAWVIVALSASLKGGDGAPGVASCGSVLYWVIVLAPVPLIAVITYFVAGDIIGNHIRKEEVGFRFVEGDLRWSRQNVIKYPAYCFFAGFAAGALGIAAGTVLGPVLLELGMLPMVATASSGFMVLFTASSTTTQFLILGQLQLDYALFFAGVGVLGAAIGNTAINYLVKRWRKTYFIIFILAAVIGTSVVLMAITGFLEEYHEWMHGKSMGFRPLCSITN